jgi:hypothetical protein
VGAWQLAKDILHTGLGLAMIASQGPWSTHSPSQLLVYAGIVLCGGNLAEHAANVLGRGAERDQSDGS